MPKRTFRMHAALAASAGMLAVTLAGCIGPVACSAIGWVNVLTITVEDMPVEVTTLQVCDQDGCAPQEQSTGDLPIGVDRIDEDTWEVTTGMSTPEELTIRLVTVDGTVLDDHTVAPEWTRVGGDETCGGPHEGTATI